MGVYEDRVAHWLKVEKITIATSKEKLNSVIAWRSNLTRKSDARKLANKKRKLWLRQVQRSRQRLDMLEQGKLPPDYEKFDKENGWFSSEKECE